MPGDPRRTIIASDFNRCLHSMSDDTRDMRDAGLLVWLGWSFAVAVAASCFTVGLLHIIGALK